MSNGQAPKSVLNLHNILVDKIDFFRKLDCLQLLDDMEFRFDSEVFEAEDQRNYRVVISVTLGDKENSDIFMNIVMSGYFSFDVDAQLDPKLKDELIKKNTLAIMFPYVRSTVTAITSQIGIQPIVLPVINIAELLEQQKSNAEKEE